MTPFSRSQQDISAPLIDNVIQQALDNQRLVGTVVLIAHHGELIYQQAAGYADRESQSPMALDHIFRLASASKPIISSAAMVLVAQGRITLDEPIDRWLPAFRPKLADGRPAMITLRQLLSHRAGLSYRFFENDNQGPYARAGISDGMDNSSLSLTENLRRLAEIPLCYEPGTAWGYSLATDVVGALIEQVSGMPLPEAVRQLVTEPLGMHDTDFSVTNETAKARVVTAYVSDVIEPHRLAEGEVVSPFDGCVGIIFNPSRIFDPQAFPSGGAGMAGTAGDLLGLLETLRQGGGDWLPDDLVAEMARDQTRGLELANVPGAGFGLGFSVLRDPQQALSPESQGTWRWGGGYGHSWFVDPLKALTVVAFTNTLYEGMSGRFVTDLRDAVYQTLEDK